MDGTVLTRLFALVLAIHCTGWIGSSSSTRVSLVDNEYVDLVFAISDAVPEDQSDIIISNIKKMILEASPVLYKATIDRAYFKRVQILIPQSWKNVNATTSSWETFQTADVIVDAPNPMHGDVPYTRQNGQCGDPGEKIHLTPNYVATLDEDANNLQFGKPGKVFVHEWAHYRYGVFDEYGTPGDTDYPYFYRTQGVKDPVPNMCSNKPPVFTTRDISNNSTKCKIDPKTQNYDKNCTFTFNKFYKPDTSLMSYHQLDSVVHFCKDDQQHAHKVENPTKHNTMCGGVSTWTVIMRSPDFANNKTKQVDLDQMTTEFNIVRSSGSRFVLVADVSDSMRICNRIEKLGESVRSWIKYDLPTGSKLGMIMFSSMAHVVSELETITDMKSRQEMMEKVPNQLFSATCIGCGLDLAVQMLSNPNDTEKSGIILLVTDGKNSPGYLSIADVQQDIVQAGIRVVSIAFGKQADKGIEHLADITDGKSYFINDDDTSEALQQAFLGACTYQSSVNSSDLQFKLFEQTVSADQSTTDIDGGFDVDPTVGRNLKLSIFNLEKLTNLESMELTAPDGNVTNTIDYETTTASVTVDLAMIGRWALNVKLKSSQTKSVQVTVTTQLHPDVSTPITTRCWVANGADIKDVCTDPIKIHAEVWKGSYPVTGATVKAFLVKPNNESEVLELLDNGVNADTEADDGVYSKYYTNATQKGRYTLKCQVISNNDTVQALGFFGSASPQLHGNVIDENDEGTPMTSFTRIASGGSFQVEIPVQSDDAYPPGEVRDLSVMLLNETEKNITIELKWTAPGDELDAGTVAYYELKYSDIAADVMNSNFDDESSVRKRRSVIKEDDLVAGSLEPIEAGSLQTAIFLLSDIDQERPYYVTLRAVDKAGKAGQVSNLVVFFVPDKSALLIVDDFDGDLEESTGFETRDIIYVKQSGSHVTSLLVAAFGLILIACLCVALLMAIVKHTRTFPSYAGIPAIENHDLPCI
ncbi:calcium-activated chloride channel regulator 4-like [Daphnia carinata]|uniref:calcium-activated chloride channel regulator 4-like n=1 Tax=Daphnia carinata TaxID=120202 RepID=UPI00257DD01B|nr:calcium-activated chloride channel regulator 4-like [Daphnia carinata]